MKIVVISDPHINDYSRFDINGSRLENTLMSIYRAFVVADQMGAEYVFMPGDLFDSPKAIYTKVMMETLNMFRRCQHEFPKITMVGISGNHDLATNSIYGRDIYSACQVIAFSCQNFMLIDDTHLTLHRNGEKVTVYGVRYYKYAEDYKMALADVIEQRNPDKTGSYNILMIHQSPNEAEGFIEQHLSVFDPEYKKFDLVVCGHIHKHQVLSNNFYVVGSPLFRDMGDAGQEKGFLVIDSLQKSVSRIINTFPDYSLELVERKSKQPVQERYAEFDYSSITDNSKLIELYLRNIGNTDELTLTEGIRLLQ